MLPKYGLPYIFEDKAGDFRGPEFHELHERMRLCIRPVRSGDAQAAYVLSSTRQGTDHICLAFGPNNALGTICIGQNGVHVQMDKYLSKPSTSSTARQFRACDGQVYTWSCKSVTGNEWTCLNANNYIVSSYSLKPPKEPPYHSSSGALFAIDENYPHIAVELLATLTIMRHISEHNLF